MEIELWSLVVVLVTGGYLVCRLSRRKKVPPYIPYIKPTNITCPVPVVYTITESRLHSCISAYSVKHGYLPTEILANYETIHTLAGFCCHTDAGLVLPTGDVVKIKLSTHSATNDLTFKGNANDTDK